MSALMLPTLILAAGALVTSVLNTLSIRSLTRTLEIYQGVPFRLSKFRSRRVLADPKPPKDSATR